MGIGYLNKQTWPTTHWSLVAEAGSEGVEIQRRALTKLILQYSPVLRWHLVVRRRVDSGQVDDLLQEFLISKVLDQQILNLADRSRGRFRSYLATVLDRFVSNQLRHLRVLKRQQGNPSSIDEIDESPIATSTQCDSFDHAWSRQVLGQALRKMHHECHIEGRADVWGVFKERTVRAALQNATPSSYADLVKKFSIASPRHAANLLTTANRKFVRILRSVVATYEMDEGQIDQELIDLWHASRWSRAGRS